MKQKKTNIFKSQNPSSISEQEELGLHKCLWENFQLKST